MMGCLSLQLQATTTFTAEQLEYIGSSWLLGWQFPFILVEKKETKMCDVATLPVGVQR